MWMMIAHYGVTQETYVKIYSYPVVPATSKNVQVYNDRIYTITNTACELGGHYVVCSALIELTEYGDTLWTTLIPDIDIASGSMVIVNDTITITGNNEPLTAWRMAHFDLNGRKLGETIKIEHPHRKFWNMFQLSTQYFNNRYVICGTGWEMDTIWSLMFVVDKLGMIDTLISIERSDRLSACWDSYIDSEGLLTTYHHVEFYRPPGPGPPRINYRRIFKFDTNYDTIWAYRSENTESNEVVPRGCQLHDGRTILSYTNPQQERNIHSVRAINPDGSKDWQHNYVVNGSRSRYIFRLKILANGDIMGSGYYGEKAGDPRIDHSPWLFRMTTEGTLLWERVYYDYDSTLASNGSSRIGALFDFIELDDGSVLGVGYLDYDSKSNMLVMRVDSNGCLDPEDCNEIVYITDNLTTSTENPGHQGTQLDIMPNPASDHIMVEWAEADDGQRIYIFDSAGRLHQTGRFTDGRSSMDVSGLSPSVYFITTDGNNRVTERFIKIE